MLRRGFNKSPHQTGAHRALITSGIISQPCSCHKLSKSLATYAKTHDMKFTSTNTEKEPKRVVKNEELPYNSNNPQGESLIVPDHRHQRNQIRKKLKQYNEFCLSSHTGFLSKYTVIKERDKLPTLYERQSREYSFHENGVGLVEELSEPNALEKTELRRPDELARTDNLKYCPYHRLISHPIDNCF